MSAGLKRFLSAVNDPLANLQKYASEHPEPTSVAGLDDEYAEFGRLHLAAAVPLSALQKRPLKDSSFIPRGKTKEMTTDEDRHQEKAAAIDAMEKATHWKEIEATDVALKAQTDKQTKVEKFRRLTPTYPPSRALITLKSVAGEPPLSTASAGAGAGSPPNNSSAFPASPALAASSVLPENNGRPRASSSASTIANSVIGIRSSNASNAWTTNNEGGNTGGARKRTSKRKNRTKKYRPRSVAKRTRRNQS